MDPNNNIVPIDSSTDAQPGLQTEHQPQPTLGPKPKKSRKLWIILAIVTVTPILVYGIVIIVDYRQNVRIEAELAKIDAEYNTQSEVGRANYKDGKPEVAKALELEQISNWAIYTDPAGFFELRYPTDWSLAANQGICKAADLELNTNKTTVSCVTDKDSQILVEVGRGQLLRSKYEIQDPGFTDIQTDSYFIDGVASFKQLGRKVQSENIYPDIAVGEQMLIYIFEKDDFTYVLRCRISDKNVSSTIERDFETMVNKTFKFKR